MGEEMDNMLGQTLEQYVAYQQTLLKMFSKWWGEQNSKDPEGFPLEMAANDTGLWDEMFSSFDPDKDSVFEQMEKEGKPTPKLTLKELAIRRKDLERQLAIVCAETSKLDAEKDQLEQDLNNVVLYITSTNTDVYPDNIAEIFSRRWNY